MKSFAVLLPLSFAIGASLCFAQPPASSPSAQITNPAAALQPATAPHTSVLNPTPFLGLGQTPAKAVVDALRPPPSPVVHDFGLVLYHSAAGDGYGARVCLLNRGTVPTPETVAKNTIQWSTDGMSFQYLEFPNYRIRVPSLRPHQSHCYNVQARDYYQRVVTTIEDNGDSFFDLERAAARAGAMRHPNSIPAYVIRPKP